MKKNIIISFLVILLLISIGITVIFFNKYSSRQKQVLKYEYILDEYENCFTCCYIDTNCLFQKYKQKGFEINEKGMGTYIIMGDVMKTYQDLYGLYIKYDNNKRIIEFTQYKP